MDDLISRQAALDAINSGMLTDDDTQFECPSECNSMLEWAVNAVKELSTADLSEYCDKLWKTAYERGKAEAHQKKGKWINHRNDEGHNIADCDQCGEAMQWFDDDIKPNYCPNCGARMEEEENG